MPMTDQMVQEIGGLPFKRFPLTPKGVDDAWNLISTDASPNVLKVVAKNLQDADGIRLLAKRLFRMTPFQMDNLMDADDADLVDRCKDVVTRLQTDPNPRMLRVHYREEFEKNSPLRITCRFGVW